MVLRQHTVLYWNTCMDMDALICVSRGCAKIGSNCLTLQFLNSSSSSVLSPFTLQAFAPAPTFARTLSTSSTATTLEACRVNAKKEKRQRNRENMRKFKKRGKVSRKKMMRKLQSNDARAVENEFIAKCFTTVVIEQEGDSNSGDDRRR